MLSAAKKNQFDTTYPRYEPRKNQNLNSQHIRRDLGISEEDVPEFIEFTNKQRQRVNRLEIQTFQSLGQAGKSQSEEYTLERFYQEFPYPQEREYFEELYQNPELLLNISLGEAKRFKEYANYRALQVITTPQVTKPPRPVSAITIPETPITPPLKHKNLARFFQAPVQGATGPNHKNLAHFFGTDTVRLNDDVEGNTALGPKRT